MGPGRLLQFLACDNRFLCSNPVSFSKALQILKALKKLKETENIEKLQNTESIERNYKKGLLNVCLISFSGRQYFLRTLENSRIFLF